MSIEAMKQALEFIEVTNKGSSFWLVPASQLNKTVTSLRQAIEQAEKQEPMKMVAYNCLCGRIMKFESVNGIVAPQREWVGLTDEEFSDCLVEGDPCEALAEPEAWAVMREVAAKLKEKNT
jgi:hypothetical protein